MIGAILFGDTSDGSRLLNLIEEKKDIPDNEKNMLLKISENKDNKVVSMVPSDIICTVMP